MTEAALVYLLVGAITAGFGVAKFWREQHNLQAWALILASWFLLWPYVAYARIRSWFG